MNNSQLPVGYKLTEVGVIPEDWELHSCSGLSERIMVGIVIRPTQYYVSQGVPAFRSANIREAGISNSDLVFISEASNALLSKSQTRTGDILTVRTGYPGTSAVVRSEHTGCNCIDILITRPSKKVDSDYLKTWINSSFGKEQVLRNQGGLAQQHFNVGDMKDLKVALPSLPEQRSIATALSDMDELLGGLDRTIAKKRDLKQATMQQLLTGKTRLPGFGDEKWRSFSIGDLFEITAGRDLVKKEFSEINSDTHPFPIYANSIFNDGLYGYSSFKEYEAGCVTVTARGTLGYACYRSVPFVAIGRLIVLRPKNDIDSFFLSEAINHRIEFASESTGVPQLTAPQIAKYELSIPTVEEQTAIASILSDMDTEIAAIEQRRNKTRDLKQAMMQELLTGRIRLV